MIETLEFEAWHSLPGDHRGGPLLPHEHAAIRFARTETSLILDINAAYYGDTPPSGPPGHHPDLWKFEVVEVFLAGPSEHYVEVEVGPHGHHWFLELYGVRQIRSQHEALSWSHAREQGAWRARVELPWSQLPVGDLRFNAFAIHGGAHAPEGVRRHLALFSHDAVTPDFHRLEHFKSLGFANPLTPV